MAGLPDARPVDFSTFDTDWSWAARLIIVVAIIGSLIGAVAALFNLLGQADDD